LLTIVTLLLLSEHIARVRKYPKLISCAEKADAPYGKLVYRSDSMEAPGFIS
jgi:hypothetical protein